MRVYTCRYRNICMCPYVCIYVYMYIHILYILVSVKYNGFTQTLINISRSQDLEFLTAMWKCRKSECRSLAWTETTVAQSPGHRLISMFPWGASRKEEARDFWRGDLRMCCAAWESLGFVVSWVTASASKRVFDVNCQSRPSSPWRRSCWTIVCNAWYAWWSRLWDMTNYSAGRGIRGSGILCCLPGKVPITSAGIQNDVGLTVFILFLSIMYVYIYIVSYAWHVGIYEFLHRVCQ
jgi:hypothetical protein